MHGPPKCEAFWGGPRIVEAAVRVRHDGASERGDRHQRRHEPPRIVGALLTTEIAEKQARYQLTIAKLPLAKDTDDFDFTGTLINETLVRQLAGGSFIAEQRNAASAVACFNEDRPTHTAEASPASSEEAAVRDPKTARIRELNDAFRRTFPGGKVVMTAGVDALPDMVKAAALQKAATFDAFTDFGSFELCGRKFFWKVEYYDRDMQYGSEDPSDPDKTTRVMTVMLADEY